jgi:hypothetical protein
MNSKKLSGSCLCGSVRYSLVQKPIEIFNCHCNMCRKSNGTAYATWVGVHRGDLLVQDKQSCLTKYKSSKQVTRSFCKICGSSLFFDHKKDTLIWMTAGTLDTDRKDLAPTTHIFVSSKAKWHKIDDDLSQFKEIDEAYITRYME